MKTDALVEAAKKLGDEHGQRRGEWLIDARMNKDGAATIIKGYEDGDPEVMALCPSPLSAEWADDPTDLQVIAEIANLAEAAHLLQNVDIDQAMEDAGSILDDYEAAYQEGFWNKVIHNAKGIVNADS